jgi:molecular chaperone GrpE
MKEEKKHKHKKCECKNENIDNSSHCCCDNDCKCNDKHDGKDSKCNCDDTIKELQDKLNEMTNVAARSQAEVINFKKRKEEETALRLKYCNEDLLLKFVEICDNFERAIKMDDNDLSDEVSKFLSGFKMMYTNMLSILEEYGVKEIEVSGLEFDSKTSEAVIVEHHDEMPAHVVIEVLRKGYMYKDKLLRPAMVKIND